MAIKVQNIKRNIVTYGQYEGRYCTVVKLGNGTQYKPNTLLTKIVDLGLKFVSFEGDFTSNPDLMSIISGLHSSGYKIIYNTDSGDEVGPMVRFKNIILSILIEIPKDGEVVNYLPHITSYLREKDEARFKISCKADYDAFRQFQKDKNILSPMKILEVDASYRDTFETVINTDIASSTDNLIIKYI